jgi:hypothetical protein
MDLEYAGGGGSVSFGGVSGSLSDDKSPTVVGNEEDIG